MTFSSECSKRENFTKDFVIESGVLKEYKGSSVDVVVPEGVANINNYAFSGCVNLKSISIPSSVISIGAYTFDSCNCLISIRVDANNSKYTSVNGVLFNKDKTTLILYPKGIINSEYIIPDSVTTIGDYAFADCKNITSVIIPDSVVSIGSYAFSGCTNLKSIEIPYSVESIGESAFPSDKSSGLCPYCGGEFEGLFILKCNKCGREKE